MKKLFTVAVFGLVLGVAQMAFSATMVDVPSGHWAEDAVQRLIDLGLIKGYPDGTFKGDRQLTRYEYAMVVDRMIDYLDENYCKEGECGGGDMEGLDEVQEIVKKLAVEFKDELAALKVKVDENSAKIADLEEDIKASRIGNIKIEGSVRQRIDIPSTDLTNFSTVFNNIYNTAVTGADVEAGYEMVPTLVFSGKSGDNVDFSIGLDKSIRTSPLGYDQQATDDQGELVINHAYADIDFSDTVRELDIVKVKAGYQSFAFGPFGMLVDNSGVTSNAGVRVDVGKDVVTLTGVGALAGMTGLSAGSTIQGLGVANRDPYAAMRLGLDLPWFDLGVNYLADGVGKEDGWGVDLVLPMLKNTPFLNELRAEYMQVTETQAGADPGATADDYSYLIGVDVYTSKRAGLTLSYADLPATVGYSSMDASPFTEYDSACPIGLDVGTTCFSYESGRNLFPAGFEGLGVQASYIVFNDVTLAARGFVGNYAGGAWGATNLDGFDYPGFAALSVSKPINSKSMFRVEYAQQGADDVLLNRVRSELVITF